ncbi:hypothetical protein [Microbacterium sp.]|uniref:hypothetical protein n=1 Tax=Microbacterium sp. TaxID=51671 RepID=UPI003A8A8378
MIAVEAAMWAKENGIVSNSRSVPTMIVVLSSASASAVVLSTMALVGVHLLFSTVAEGAVTVALVIFEVITLVAATGAGTRSARTLAQRVPYARLYGDALRVEPEVVLFVRGQLPALLKIGACLPIVITCAIIVGPFPWLLPGVLLLVLAAIFFVLRVVPLRPGRVGISWGSILSALVAGMGAGLALRVVARAPEGNALPQEWVRESVGYGRFVAEVVPIVAVVGLCAVVAVATRAARRVERAPLHAPVYGWITAMGAITGRGVGRGSELLLRTLNPLAAAIVLVSTAAAVAPASIEPEHPAAIAVRALPLIFAMIVSTALSSFFGAAHVLPLLNLTARFRSRSVWRGVVAYLLVIASWIVPTPAILGIAGAVLTGSGMMVASGFIVGIAAVGGVLVGSLFDRYALRLPDGTIELSLWGHTLSGLAPTVAAFPMIAWGTQWSWASLAAGLLVVWGSACVLYRRVRPL